MRKLQLESAEVTPVAIQPEHARSEQSPGLLVAQTSDATKMARGPANPSGG